MRVILVCLLAACWLTAAPTPAAAQPGVRVDPGPIVAALTNGERLVRAPGTVARFDEARVLEELGQAVRLVVLPYVDYDLYPREGDHSQYFELVTRPILAWSLDRKVPVVVVTGLDVTMYSGPSTLDHRLPADFDELRTTTATMDITERLVVLARFGRGLPPAVAEDVDFVHPAPVPAPPDRVAEVVAALRAHPVHNAPGRADVIEDRIVTVAREEYGLGVRVAAFPGLAPGQPVTDYATPLGAAFPDDVVLVLHGGWLDVVAPDQAKALAARAFAYGDANLSLLSSGSRGHSLLSDTLKRLDLLMTETAWGFPQPPPQPRAVPFEVRRAVSALAPWVLVGSAVVISGAGVLRHRRRAAAAAADEERALRAESASAMAAIGDLGARVLTAEEGGEPVDPAAAERHTTARLLYDQAHTSVAMTEVRLVAEEGLALLTEPEPVEAPAAAVRPKRRRRKKAKAARKDTGTRPVWRKAR
ncbi:hypothetical protein [Actinophytocola glycyrrhizae]|uniref:Uncharacterized protein n=1 Tax=Actinophytocola glycyrrhizae TaxID=2044873 RepID=A0ABV9RS32_9PSEU